MLHCYWTLLELHQTFLLGRDISHCLTPDVHHSFQLSMNNWTMYKTFIVAVTNNSLQFLLVSLFKTSNMRLCLLLFFITVAYAVTRIVEPDFEGVNFAAALFSDTVCQRHPLFVLQSWHRKQKRQLYLPVVRLWSIYKSWKLYTRWKMALQRNGGT